jgi:hypothetical protein
VIEHNHDATREQEKSRLGTALRRGRRAIPAGFSVRVMQQILTEKVRRAERAARWQSALFASGLAFLAMAAVALLIQLELSQADWFQAIPVSQLAVILVSVLVFSALDRFLSIRFQRSAPD